MGADLTIRITPTISTSPAYSVDDQLGGLQTLTTVSLNDSRALRLDSIGILDKGKQSATIDCLFFNAAPTIASSDNAALDITDANMSGKWIGTVTLFGYRNLSGSSVCSVSNLGLILQPAAGTATLQANSSLYVVCAIRTAVTYASTTDLEFIYGFSRV
jgi:hypothetical protein